jgi:hypothetical protein
MELNMKPSLRKRPSVKLGKEILAWQNGQCLYCGIHIGSFYKRGTEVFVSKLHWDHFVPFSYLQMNPKINWVASCDVCNQIKTDKIFNDLREARGYIEAQRRKKKITIVNDSKTVKEQIYPLRHRRASANDETEKSHIRRYKNPTGERKKKIYFISDGIPTMLNGKTTWGLKPITRHTK